MWLIEKIKLALGLTWDMIVSLYNRVDESIELLWKGMLAIFLALGIICIFTIVMNKIINKIKSNKQAKN